MTKKPVIVLITTHGALSAMMERHGDGIATMVTYSTLEEFERNALRVNAKILIVDEEHTDVAVADIAKLQKHAVLKKLITILLCPHATPTQIAACHAAGYDDIMMTTHHTPRAVMTRISSLFL